MPWHARLDVDYRRQHGTGRTLADFRHQGPLRILKSLYPEGAGVCHNVLIHPPGGLVGGDRLDIRIHLDERAHGMFTTPGATRFYRSLGDVAVQDTRIVAAPGARMEWLPMETLCYDGCIAENRLSMQLGEDAQALGWDVVALGLPQSRLPFLHGRLTQHTELTDIWLDRGCVDAGDSVLMDGPLGLAGHRCMASLWLASGTPFSPLQREQALDAARSLIDSSPLRFSTGATSPHPQIVLVRTLAPLVEPAMQLLRDIRNAWRSECWKQPVHAPRIWAI